LYTRNQYEWFLYVHQCQSRWNVICFYSLKYRRVRRINLNPNFPNWIIQIIFFVYFLHIYDTNNLSNKLLHIFLYLVNIILKNLERFFVGSIYVLRDNLLLLTQYTCRIKESSMTCNWKISLFQNIFSDIELISRYLEDESELVWPWIDWAIGLRRLYHV